MRKLLKPTLIFVGFFLCGIAIATEIPNSLFTPQTLNQYEKQYGASAKMRLLAWKQLMHQDMDVSDRMKLELVNNFFNKINYHPEAIKRDHWMTPMEFLAKDVGDCEDFAIAKYFTLKAMGIPEEKLRITYVQAQQQNTAHMVLAYYETVSADPLILDNLVKEIKPASERPDLIPVYSFNGEGLWLARRRNQDQRVGGSDRISLWQELNQRMQKEETGAVVAK